MVFSSSGLMASVVKSNIEISQSNNKKFISTTSTSGKHRKQVKRIKKTNEQPIGCKGISINLNDRIDSLVNPYSFPCSLKCRHPVQVGRHNNELQNDRRPSFNKKSEKWVSDIIYKRYTETDSRPLSPNIKEFVKSSSMSSRHGVGSDSVGGGRKCITPEPETKQCKFYQRRTLVLDLRRVKSVDMLQRQGSTTTNTTSGTSNDDLPNYLDDDDHDDNVMNERESELMLFSNLNYRNTKNEFGDGTQKSKGGLTARNKQQSQKRKDESNIEGNEEYARSLSPKFLEALTLPPLHASVLALLSQRSASAKGTPRNGLTSSLFGNQTTNSKNKAQVKLRRQNRKSKKNSSKDTDDADIGESSPLELVQQNNLQHELNNVSKENEENQPEVDVKKQNKLNPNRKSLQQVLDEYLAKNSWHIQDSSKLEKEIEELKASIKKTDTNLNSKNISFREDVWLSFPKTWSYSSATFQAPKSGLELKTLTPLEYLRKYVVISQPRKHLYDLVFERHRTLENPLGRTIPVQVAIKALSEVMGQTFRQGEAQDLFYNLLNVKPPENDQLELDQVIFGGICAACERIYGKYEMENTADTPNNLFKQRNSNISKGLNNKSQLETADLEYLASKIMDNQVDKHLAKLLSAICAKAGFENKQS